MTAQTFTIGVPPSVNGLFANVPGKGRRKTKRYKVWRQDAGWSVRMQRVQPVVGPVEIALRMRRPSWNSDLDNRIKAVPDLLVELGLINDDRETHKISAEWAEVDGCEVTLRART